jgi:tRNA (mo5U34)-methyltransferase
LPIPASLAGKRCLDIGGRDGFYAFEMERRGAAEVVSLDIADPAELDHAGPRPDEQTIRGELEAGQLAFQLARDALGSRVERRNISAYDLSTEAVGSFDFAVIGTLLLHLRDPVGALAAVRGVLDGDLLLNEPVVTGYLGRTRRPLAEILMRDGYPFWWVCNPAGLRRMASAAGFAIREASRPYMIPYGRGYEVPTVAESLPGPLSELPRRLRLRRGAPHVWLLARPGG